jgi:hypothetical protein
VDNIRLSNSKLKTRAIPLLWRCTKRDAENERNMQHPTTSYFYSQAKLISRNHGVSWSFSFTLFLLFLFFWYGQRFWERRTHYIISPGSRSWM